MSIKIHAVQTGSIAVKRHFLADKHGVSTVGGLLSVTRDPNFVRIPILAWVIEHPEGIFVVDTGESANAHSTFIGTADTQPAEEIDARLSALGIAISDVRAVILTHMHTDHIGGLRHFANTPIYIDTVEQAAQQTFNGKVSQFLTKVPAPTEL